MKTKLEHLLTNCCKAEMIAHIKSHPEDFEEAVNLALADKRPYSWRAAWLLWSCMDENDQRLTPHTRKMIEILPTASDNQMRELMIILQRLHLPDDCTGKLFNTCASIWGKSGKQPSVRYNAFKLLVKIAKKHPDLSREVLLLTDASYMNSLSNNVNSAIYKMAAELTCVVRLV